MSVHFFESEISLAMGMIVLPVRSTVIKTSKGLIIISPIRFSDEQFKEIEKLGSVNTLVAPSLIHHLFLPNAIERFKSAQVWGPVGSPEKLPKIQWNFLFGKDQWPLIEEVDFQLIEGAPGMNEVAFFEKSSKTLVLTDFVFNLTNPKGWGAPVMLRLLGTFKRFAVSRFVYKFIVDKSAVEKSFRKILQWDFDKIVMGHGEVVTVDAKLKLQSALKFREIC